MQLGKVIGTVWSTRKDEKLVGSKFLIVKQLDLKGNLKDNFVVTVDSVGAGVGEVVLYASGSSARQTIQTKDKPVDAVIMAIVDKLDISVHDNIQKAKSWYLEELLALFGQPENTILLMGIRCSLFSR